MSKPGRRERKRLAQERQQRNWSRIVGLFLSFALVGVVGWGIAHWYYAPRLEAAKAVEWENNTYKNLIGYFDKFECDLHGVPCACIKEAIRPWRVRDGRAILAVLGVDSTEADRAVRRANRKGRR